MNINALELRPMAETDRDKYVEMVISHNQQIQWVAKVDAELISQVVWEEIRRDKYILTYTIINRDTNVVLGFCNLQKINTPTPEIGVDILDGFTNRGYAQAAVRIMMNDYMRDNKATCFIWKTASENLVSIHIAEKLGGEYVDEKPEWTRNMIESALKHKVIDSENDVPKVKQYRILVESRDHL